MLSEVLSVGAKMVKTRRPLGCLASTVNVEGEDHLRRRAGRERTGVERQTRVMRERQEETWRGLTRQRVAAFFELFLRCMVWTENGEREGRPHPEIIQALLGNLVNKVIPWVDQHRIWTHLEWRWPMTLDHFHEMDNDLANYLPSVHAGRSWQRIHRYFGDMARVREERRRAERERSRERANQVRRVLFP